MFKLGTVYILFYLYVNGLWKMSLCVYMYVYGVCISLVYLHLYLFMETARRWYWYTALSYMRI